ncbi:sugar porter family MFS transporter [Streptomyces sp. AJS327]|uniref:MFS transporter n=1 Tax=Streptomyces sp. AJS327 TaxID=2545265 RepID=UPI0015DDCCE0|nr:MFS transporter [Streptomyces sp. AJS327]MBA0053965.1 sugar porter family MFS transporter [Streptomyces sp. AJS327]
MVQGFSQEPGTRGPVAHCHPAGLRRVRRAGLLIAVGGFLFGYDTGVVSGALLYLRQDFGLGSLQQGTVVSVTLIGAMVGALVSGRIADRLGRRTTLGLEGVVFGIGTVLASTAGGYVELVVARVVLGLAVGAASATVPVYLAEISPPEVRGRVLSTNQLLITVGIVTSYLVDLAFAGGGNWRAMFAVGLLPALTLIVAALWLLPESPHWLIRHGHTERGRRLIASVSGEERADELLARAQRDTDGTPPDGRDDTNGTNGTDGAEDADTGRAGRAGGGPGGSDGARAAEEPDAGAGGGSGDGGEHERRGGEDDRPEDDRPEHDRPEHDRPEDGDDGRGDGHDWPRHPAHPDGNGRTGRTGWRMLLEPEVRPALVVGLTLAAVQQLGGINTIIYYAPTIIERTGLDASNSIFYSVFIGLINLVMTVVAMKLIDRVGRRPLLLWSLGGMLVTLALLGLSFVAGLNSELTLLCMVVYIAAYAGGLGPIFWVLVGEVFPPRARALGSSSATTTNWLANFVVGLVFLPLANAIGEGGTFWIFGGVCLVGLLFVARFVPETRNREFDEVDAALHARFGRRPHIPSQSR